MEKLRTAEVARRGGVNLQSVRFYERQGLLRRPARSPNGYRAFSQEDVARLRFIKRAQELGFSLKEVAELIELRGGSSKACDEVRTRAAAKIEDIDRKLRELRKIRRELMRLSRACAAKGRVGCPILKRLNGE